MTPPSLIDPAQRSAEPFRTLRLALQLRTDADRGNCLLFTSAEKGAGKTTIALNYAVVASLGLGSVLLVDGHLRAPRIHELLGLARAPGLVDLFSSGVPLEDAVFSVPGFDRLKVLTAGSELPYTADLVASSRMSELLAQAADAYDLVVIDAPPVTNTSDAEGFAAQPGVQIVLVVTPATRRRSLAAVVRRLRLLEASVAGVVVNREGRLTA